MQETEQQRLALVSVTTVDGATTVHRYVPSSKMEGELIPEFPFFDRIQVSLAGKRKYLLLEYPFVVYRTKHIARIQVDSQGVDDLLEQVKGPIGFPIPS